MKYISWVALLVTSLCLNLVSLPVLAESSLYLQQITPKHGLSQNQISTILVDNKGLVWIGTPTGLNLYDGYDVRRISGKDNILINEGISFLYQDIDNSIWVSTDYLGLLKFTDTSEQIETIIKAPPNFQYLHSVNTLHSLDSEYLLIGRGRDVLSYHRSTGEFSTLFSGQEFGLAQDAYVRAIDTNEQYIFIASSSGLFVQDRTTKHTIKVNHIDARYRDSENIDNTKSLYVDPQSLWVGTVDGLLRISLNFIADSFVNKNLDPGQSMLLSEHNIWDILATDDGLLLSTDKGLIKYNWVTQQSYPLVLLSESNIQASQNLILKTIDDDQGNYWMATQNHGLVLLSSFYNHFDSYGLQQGLSDPVVWSLVEDPKTNSLWVGSDNGFNRIDLVSDAVSSYAVDPKGRSFEEITTFYSIFLLDNGQLVLGAGSADVTIFDPQTNTSSELILPVEAEEQEGSLNWLHSVIDNQLWFSNEQVIFTYDLQTQTKTLVEPLNRLLPASQLLAVWEGRSDSEVFLVTLDARLLRYDRTTGQLASWFALPEEQELGSIYIGNFVFADNLMWLAVNGYGLVAIDINTQQIVHRYHAGNKFQDNLFYGIQIDDEGLLWFSTHAGLVRFDPHTEQYVTFTVQNGIPDNEFNSGAFTRLSDGRFAYGHVQGLSLFDPNAFEFDQNDIPKVLITNVSLMSRPLPEIYHVEQDYELALDYDDLGLMINFSSLQYSRQRDVRYRVTLSGSKQIEYPQTTDNYILLSSLEPGQYTLTVESISPFSGEFSPPAKLRINVSYALFSSPLAYACYLFIVIAAILLWHRYQLQQRRIIAAAHSEASKSEERLSMALTVSESSVWDWDREKNAFYGQRNQQVVTNFPDTQIESGWLAFADYLQFIHDDDKSAFSDAWQQFIDGKEGSFEATYRMRGADGEWLWFHDLGRVIARDERGAILRVLGTYTNVTKRFRRDRQTRVLAEIFKQTNDCILITDEAGFVTSFNNAFSRTFQLKGEDIVGKSVGSIDHFEHRITDFESLKKYVDRKGKIRFEEQFSLTDGPSRSVIININRAPIESQKLVFYIFSMTDVSELKEAQEKLRQLASYDSLTGLPNRALLLDRIEHGIALSKRRNSTMAMFFIDLDKFKQVNDSLGHDVGDQLLVTVAQRLKQCLRNDDTVARLGGDEFVILLQSYKDENDLRRIAQKIIDNINEPMLLSGQSVSVSPSIGVAIYPDDASNAADLIKAADVAMYHAKEKGRNNSQFFTFRMNDEADARLRFENELKAAVKNNEFINYYQPIVCTQKEQIVTMELLLRWQTSTGIISPSIFIDTAEDLNLIETMTVEALDRALFDLNQWDKVGFSPALSINISAQYFESGRLLQDVTSLLRKHKLGPERIILEITESVWMQDLESIHRIMGSLVAMGFKIYLDDFGTGYSSLSYLQRLPIDTIKIDRSFVQDVEIGKEKNVLVESILALSSALNINSIAEGVEYAEQAEYLNGLGCHYHQGYLYSKPCNAEQAVHLNQIIFNRKISRISDKG